MRIWWWWLIMALLVAATAVTGMGALSAPWRWTMDQKAFAILAACLGYVALVWGTTWLRGGSAAVQARWARLERMPELIQQRSMASRQKQLLI